MNAIDRLIKKALEYLWETMTFPESFLNPTENEKSINTMYYEDKEHEED